MAAPSMRKATSLPWLMTGQVRVMRQVSFCGTWLAMAMLVRLSRRLGVGEERGGVAVVAHAEEDEIEGGGFGAFELEGVADGGLVAGGGDFGVELAFHAEDLVGGEWDFGEHGFVGHAVVGFGVVGRDAALVDPVEVELVPWDWFEEWLGWIGEECEHCLGGGAAGDGYAGEAAGCDGFDGGVGEELCGGTGYGGGSGGDAVGDGYWAGHVSLFRVAELGVKLKPVAKVLQHGLFALKFAPFAVFGFDEGVCGQGAPGSGGVVGEVFDGIRGPGLEDGGHEGPGGFDAVAMGEEGGVAEHGVEQEALVAVGGGFAEGFGVAEVHVDGADVHAGAGDLGSEAEGDALVGLDAHGDEVRT